MQPSPQVTQTLGSLVLLVNLAATLFMTGVIWIVQVVHYPLFGAVGREAFPAYIADHNTLITLIVLPAMLLEIGSAFVLIGLRPASVPMWGAVLGFAMVVLLWAATFLLATPQHGILLSGFDETAHRALVGTNWVRTALWSGRSALVLWFVAQSMA